MNENNNRDRLNPTSEAALKDAIECLLLHRGAVEDAKQSLWAIPSFDAVYCREILQTLLSGLEDIYPHLESSPRGRHRATT